MHWAHGGEVLVDDRLNGAPALGNVALHAADEADVGVGVHKNFYVKKFPQFGFGEDQNALDHDHRLGINVDRFRRA